MATHTPMAPSPIANWGAFSPRIVRRSRTSRQLWVDLAHLIFNGQEPPLATGCEPNDHKGAEFVVFAAYATVDAVSPDLGNGSLSRAASLQFPYCLAQSRL